MRIVRILLVALSAIALFTGPVSAAGPTGVPDRPVPCVATGGGQDFSTDRKSDVTFGPNSGHLWCNLRHRGGAPAVPGQYTGTGCVYGRMNLGSYTLTVYQGGRDALLICG